MPNPARPQATAAWLDALSDGPIGVSVARRSGLSTGRIHAAVSANEVVCLRRGIVISRRRWESGDANARHRWALAAALLAFPEACASHESAARLHGLPDFGLREIDVSGFPEVHITRLGAARKEHWLRVHGCERPPECVVVAGDVPVTNLIRTSIELGAARSLRRSLVFIDSAMRLAIVESAPGVSERAAVLDGARRAWATDQWNEALRHMRGVVGSRMCARPSSGPIPLRSRPLSRCRGRRSSPRDCRGRNAVYQFEATTVSSTPPTWSGSGSESSVKLTVMASTQAARTSSGRRCGRRRLRLLAGAL